jgi:hypothetical protein
MASSFCFRHIACWWSSHRAESYKVNGNVNNASRHSHLKIILDWCLLILYIIVLHWFYFEHHLVQYTSDWMLSLILSNLLLVCTCVDSWAASSSTVTFYWYKSPSLGVYELSVQMSTEWSSTVVSCIEGTKLSACHTVQNSVIYWCSSPPVHLNATAHKLLSLCESVYKYLYVIFPFHHISAEI